MFVRHLIAVFMLLAPFCLLALNPDRPINQYIHESWIDKDGLPVNTITAITQTPDGYLWLGTEEGLVRFDGIRFVTYTEENTPAFASRHIMSLFVDHRGTLWIGTYNGLVRHEAGRFSRLEVTPLPTAVFGLAGDRRGTLWIAAANGLFSLKDDLVTRYSVDDGFPSDEMWSLAIDREQAIWVSSGRINLCRFTPDTRPACHAYPDLITKVYLDRRQRLWIGTYAGSRLHQEPGPVVQYISPGVPLYAEAMHEDRDGNLWIGSREQELVKRSPRDRIFRNDVLHDPIGPVKSIFEDRERNLWVGTGGNGLHRFSDSRIAVYGQRNGLSTDIVLPVQRTASSGVVFGTYDGKLYRLNENELEPVPLPGVPPIMLALTLIEDRNGLLWVGTRGQGLIQVPRHGPAREFKIPSEVRSVAALYEDRSGAIWMALRGDALLRWDGERFERFDDPKDFFANVHTIRESPGGDLWFASGAAGLAMRRGDTFIFGDSLFRDALPSRAIQTLHPDSRGLLWISTNGSGLFIWNGERITPVKVPEGMSVSLVYNIIEDHIANLWMSTNRGILRLERSEVDLYLRGSIPHLSPLVFTTSHGLKSAECVGGVQQTADRGSDGKLYFATVKGLAVIDPDNLPTNIIRPPVRIEQVVVDNRPLSPAELEAPDLEKGIARLEVHYTALSFINPSYITFKYKLEGFDPFWVSVGNNRDAYYTNLRPGDYTFRVIAANSDGIWNEEGASFSFRIRPLFYQTVWFYFFLTGSVLLCGYLIFLLRVRAIRAQNRRLSSLVEEKTRDLTNVNERLREMSLIDPLTGLRNRRYFSDILKAEAASYLRARTRVASGLDQRNIDQDKVWGVFLADADYFKQVNDRFGHDSGDLILTQMATLFKNAVRADDVVIRWGGEEFLVVLRNSVPDYLPAFAEKLRTLVQNSFLRTAGGDLIRKTVSIGFVPLPFYRTDPERITIEQAVSIADLGLYYAKQNGRNRSVHIEAGGRIADTAPEEMQKMLADLDASVRNGFFSIAEK